MDIARRITKLEATFDAGGSGFEKKLRKMAEKLGADPECMIAATKGHESYLSPQIQESGTLTWEAFQHLHRLGVFQ
jgi:hypothetical protein